MAKTLSTVAVTLMLYSPASAQAANAVVQPPPFSSMQPGAALAPWVPVRLGIGKRPTRYEWVRDGDEVVLHAVADRAASGVAHPVAIDVRKTPLMAWRWKVAGLIPDADVRVAAHEDSPVRILLGFDGDRSKLTPIERMQHAIWKQIVGHEPPYATLAYVWSNDLAADTLIDSPHTRRIQLIVASTGARSVGSWQSLARDVRADFRRAFGEAPGMLISISIVTDTDDTRSHAEAWYGDIRFGAATRVPADRPAPEAPTAAAPAGAPPGASAR